MSKIFCILGKSGVGKDTIFSELMNDSYVQENFSPIITCTTRPKRCGEVDGKEYYFVDENFIKEHEPDIMECREYTVANDNDVWKYCTLKNLLDTSKNYIVVCSIAQYTNYIEYENKITKNGSEPEFMFIPIYVHTDPVTRLIRMIDRANKEDDPEERLFITQETCRRFLQDNVDYDVDLVNILPDYYRVSNEKDVETAISNIMKILKD